MIKFLVYKEKNGDRDACKYVDGLEDLTKPSIRLCGPCFSTHFDPQETNYKDVDTFLSEKEWNSIFIDRTATIEDLQKLFNKHRYSSWVAKVIDEEAEYLSETFQLANLSENEWAEILEDGINGYQDQGLVITVYKNAEELAHYYIDEIEMIFRDRQQLADYFDFDAYGKDLIYEDEDRFMVLDNGAVIEFEC